MVHRRHLRKGFKLFLPPAHELRNAGEIPVSVSHHGMPHISGQSQHLLIDIYFLSMPEQHAANNKGEPQIMDARAIMRSAIDPSQLISYADKHAMNLARVQRMSQQSSTRTDKKRRLIRHFDS